MGIEDCLHIYFEFTKSILHLNDCIIGKIEFHEINVPLKSMQININKIETIGEGAFQKIQSQTVAVYELMDGNPIKDEVIPVRMYLTNFDLTPSYRDKDKKFHVKYYLSLVLIEKNGRKYFKKREIWLWRKNFK